MLLVESLESQPYSRTCQTVVASGGIEDRVFRIIVSAEYYRDRAKRDDRSGLFLSLYNDRDLLVERSKIFTSQGYGRNTSTKNHHIFGKHDQIVTKSKVGYFYKVEYKPSDSDSMVEVQGLMCKIFPESGRRTSYKMQDAEGDQGLFMGAVDSRDRAHGQGVLDYEDGKRFVGSFHSGSIADGVLYRGAHVTHTLHQGKWTESNDASLVRKYPVSMLVYDSLEKSRSRGGTSNSNRTQYQASNRHHSAPRRSAYNDDASYHSGYRSHASKRPGMINTSFEETFVSALPAHGSGARHNDDIDELFSHQRGRPRSANKQRLGKVASKGGYETALPAGALPALQGGMRFIDDDDSVDMSRSPHGLRSARSAESLGSRVSFADRRNDILNGVRGEKVTEQDQHKVDLDGDERIYPLNRRALSDDMGGLFAPGRNHEKERKYHDDDVSSLHSGFRLEEMDVFKDSSRNAAKIHSSLVLGLVDEEEAASIHSGARSSSKKNGSLGRFDQDDLDSTRRASGRGEVAFPDHSLESLEHRLERLDEDAASGRNGVRGPSREGRRMGLLREEDEDEVDARDVLNTTRLGSHLSSDKKVIVRPMLMMVEGMVKHVTGGSVKKLLKSGTLQDGVKSILVSAERFQDIERQSKLILTLYDNNNRVVKRLDLFGSPPKNGCSPFRLLEENEDIVSMAKPGFYYQLEYMVTGAFEDTITLAGLICKIIPASKSAPTFAMLDPEGLKGRYMGAADVNGDAQGKGTFEYESGCTFVGQFQRGKWVKGAYYRGTQLMGTMKEEKWDTSSIDIRVAKEFAYDVLFFSKGGKVKNVVENPANPPPKDDCFILHCF